MKLTPSIAALALLCASAANAVEPDPRLRPFANLAAGSQEEYTKLIKAAESIPPYSGGLFGESVNLYSGATEFSTTDISLSGNNAIPVSFGRRFVVESRGGGAFNNRYALGDWDMAVPHLSGVFVRSLGWTLDLNGSSPGGQSSLRCSGPTTVDQARPPIYPSNNIQYDLPPEDYWQGSSLYLPGQGNQELLLLTNPNLSRPSDGRDYRWVSKGQWFFACTPLLNGSGDGFIARSPEGLTYYFDHLVALPHPGVVQKYVGPGGLSERVVDRDQVRLYPTLITDRFQSGGTPSNNWVRYSWNGSRLESISSNDGRSLTLAYGSNGKIASVTAPESRQWSYAYDGTAQNPTLRTVTLPDTSTWQLHLDTVQWGETYYASPPQYDGPACDKMQRLDSVLNVRTAYLIHPSGARGDFEFDVFRHGRTSVSSQCIADDDPPDNGHNLYPVNFDTLGLKSKHISGVGGIDYTWHYNYPAVTGCLAGDVCPDRKTVEVIAPDGIRTASTFGIRFEENEAQLLSTSVYAANGDLLRQQDVDYVASAEVANYPFPNTVGDTPQPRLDAFFAARLRPQKQRLITQNGDTFHWSASAYDLYANPTTITRASSLGYTRSETTLYHHNTAHWVLGQVASVTETGTGAVMRSNSYDPTTATLTSTREFGQPATALTYWPDGTVRTHKVGSNPVTTFSNYKRGLARNIALADGQSLSITVDDLGQITSLTDAAANTTEYRYDFGGRLNRIIYPVGDSTLWNDTTLDFVPVAATEYGLGDGHWKQTVSTGTARSETYFDALWRPVLSRSYDSADLAGTQRMTQRRFDSEGRTSFVSYPKPSIASYSTTVDGTTTTYDALGRVYDITAASELGPLVTSTRYYASFEKQVTNPRLNTTTYRFQAFDEPREDAPVTISEPLATTTTIARDVFGKPTAMTRSGTYLGLPVSVTRRYVYDANQRLCKTLEPESGATVQAYDSANRLAWKASGQNLTGITTCDTTSVAANQKVSYGYDNLDRLLSTSYGDNSPSVTRTYTPDGLLETTSSDGSVWTTLYNKRRLMTSETLKLDGVDYPLGYTYTSNGHVASLSYPDTSSVAYTPNALGEATQVGNYATQVMRHPNGALRSFRYGNAIVHSTEQNLRGLPRRSHDSGVLDDAYTYDENGNVTAITDHHSGTNLFTRTMGYDARDRLTSATNAALWTGTLSFTYDPLDNLRTTGIPKFGDWTFQYNASTQRLDRIDPSGGGTPILSYGYDTRGRANARSNSGAAQTFVTDLADRVRSIGPAVASYRYDGHGRRTAVTKSGTTTLQIYSQAGQLVYQSSPSTSDGIFRSGFQSTDTPYPPSSGGSKRYLYLGRHLIAEDGAAGRRYIHTDGLGSPARTTDAAGIPSGRNDYKPYGWGPTPQSTPSFTGHVADAETGLLYMQARYYDPFAGRFLAVDPVAATPRSFNRYWYADNNPYKNIDPDGRATLEIVEAAFLADVATPEPSDVAWPKWAIWAAIGGTAAAVDYVVIDTIGSAIGDFSPGSAASDLGVFSPIFITLPTAWPAPGSFESSTLLPGPYAGDKIPARGPERDFTPGEREDIDRIGRTTGCHTCGTTEPGTVSGHFVPDHQPPSATNTDGKPQELYPHCLGCSKRQGGEVRKNQRRPPPSEEKKEND